MRLTVGWRRTVAIAAAVELAAAYCALVAVPNRPVAARAVGTSLSLAGTSTTSTTTPNPAAATNIRPGTLRAPRFGTYDLRVDSNGAKTVGTLTVKRNGSQLLTVGQHMQTSKLVWSSRAQLSRTGAERGASACTWTPAPIVIVADLHSGRQWSNSASCATTTGSGVVTITRQESAKVIRLARATLDGAPIATWVIERHVVTTHQRGAATEVVEQASSELFAPSLGLPVFTLVRTEKPLPDGTVRTLLESIELTSGTPH